MADYKRQIDGYDTGIRYADEWCGRILNALADEGVLDETAILITSDHGEYLGDYLCFGKRGMHDAAARVPLLLRYPAAFPRGVRCDAPASLVDVFPTLLALGGSRSHAGDADGTDLAEVAAGQHDDRTIFSQYQRDARGVFMALIAIALAIAPRTPGAYASGVLVYALSCGMANGAFFSAHSLRDRGREQLRPSTPPSPRSGIFQQRTW
jgi:hypothetical protein